MRPDISFRSLSGEDALLLAGVGTAKDMRNLADRGILRHHMREGVRVYSVEDALSYRVIARERAEGLPITAASLIAAAAIMRLQERAKNRLLGTDKEMRFLIVRFETKSKDRNKLQLKFKPVFMRAAEIRDLVKDDGTIGLAPEPNELRIIPLDAEIERLWRRWQTIVQPRFDKAEA